jgi:hypothetical protein
VVHVHGTVELIAHTLHIQITAALHLTATTVTDHLQDLVQAETRDLDRHPAALAGTANSNK